MPEQAAAARQADQSSRSCTQAAILAVFIVIWFCCQLLLLPWPATHPKNDRAVEGSGGLYGLIITPRTLRRKAKKAP